MPVNKLYEGENAVALLNRFQFFYSIESSLTNRSTTQRGVNGTDIADIRMDVENIIFTVCIKFITHIILKQDGVNCISRMENTPELITKAFHLTFKLLDKAVLFTEIKDELLRDIRFKKDEKACEYFNSNVKVFVNWLDYRSTFFSISTHIRNILNKKRNFY